MLENIYFNIIYICAHLKICICKGCYFFIYMHANSDLYMYIRIYICILYMYNK
jgi:hypothetical protein